MAADLETRRQAIAEALRAVMAEPFPDRAAPPVPTRTVATSAPWFTPAPVHTADPPPRATPDPVRARQLEPVVKAAPAEEPAPTPLREALAAQIDWDEVDDLDSLDDLHGEAFDAEPESPTVPPLETTVSMSRSASLALFGHA